MTAWRRKADKRVVELRDLLTQLTPEERVQVFIDVEDGWCRHCGWRERGGCHCQNDE